MCLVRKGKGNGNCGSGLSTQRPEEGPFGGDREAVCSFCCHMLGDLRLLYDNSSSDITTKISGGYLLTRKPMGEPYKLFVLQESNILRCMNHSVEQAELFDFYPSVYLRNDSAVDTIVTAKLGEIKDLPLKDDKRSKTGAEMVEGKAVPVDRKKLLLGRVVAVVKHSDKANDKIFFSQTCCVIARAGKQIGCVTSPRQLKKSKLDTELSHSLPYYCIRQQSLLDDSEKREIGKHRCRDLIPCCLVSHQYRWLVSVRRIHRVEEEMIYLPAFLLMTH